jgi:hypothetical protein
MDHAEQLALHLISEHGDPDAIARDVVLNAICHQQDHDWDMQCAQGPYRSHPVWSRGFDEEAVERVLEDAER